MQRKERSLADTARRLTASGRTVRPPSAIQRSSTKPPLDGGGRVVLGPRASAACSRAESVRRFLRPFRAVTCKLGGACGAPCAVVEVARRGITHGPHHEARKDRPTPEGAERPCVSMRMPCACRWHRRLRGRTPRWRKSRACPSGCGSHPPCRRRSSRAPAWREPNRCRS